MAASQRLLRCIAQRNGLLGGAGCVSPALGHQAIRHYATSGSEDITIEVNLQAILRPDWFCMLAYARSNTYLTHRSVHTLHIE